MPRVIVLSDANQSQRAGTPVLLDERVDSSHLDDYHSAMQFVQRLGWAISDAEDLEHAPHDGQP
jgi:hypothetical protein